LALMRTIGLRLRWVRDALGMTQEQIASAVGIAQDAWSLYELGKRWPDLGTASRMIAKLKITHAYLVEGSLDGVERQLAIRLAAYHPELALPTRTDHHMDRLRA
jgi:transcriptional regulator with XRE-family HTH domain